MKLVHLLIAFLVPLLSLGQDAELTKFTYSECDEEVDPYRIRTRVVQQEFAGDTLQLEVATVAACCVDFEPSFNYRNDTLNVTFKETGIGCDCICAYHFAYHIIGLKEKDFTTKLQGKTITFSDEKFKTFPIRYMVYKGDTTGYFDKHGLEQGYRITSFKKDRLLETHFKDGQIVKHVLMDQSRNILKETEDWDDFVQW